MTDKEYEAWPYKDMNGFCLDIGDTIKLIGYGQTWDWMKIIGFTLDGNYVYTNTGLKLPTRKVLWIA
jgi:hypothetical protein